jgi:hypothetical protein
MFAPQPTDNKMATETYNKDINSLKFLYQSNGTAIKFQK